MVELRQLRHFVAVVDADSLSGAASALGMAQSGISTSLAALERELGATLLLRSPGRRSVELTEAGRALLLPARQVLEAAESAGAAVHRVVLPSVQVLKVLTVALPPPLSPLQASVDYMATHPGVQVLVLQVPAGNVAAQIAQGEADLGVTALSPGEAEGLHVDLVTANPLRLVCSTRSALAAADDVVGEDLRGQRLLSLPRVHRTRTLMEAWLSAQSTSGPTSRSSSGANAALDDALGVNVIETDDVGASLYLVAAGEAVTYMPEMFTIRLPHPLLTSVPLRDAPLWELSLIRRPDAAASQACVDLYQAYLLDITASLGSSQAGLAVTPPTE